MPKREDPSNPPEKLGWERSTSWFREHAKPLKTKPWRFEDGSQFWDRTVAKLWSDELRTDQKPKSP